MGLSISEQIKLDGEDWEIERHVDVGPDFWTGHGTEAANRGCVVSAFSREALIKHIPIAREKHRMASRAMGMESAIVRVFKDAIDINLRSGYKGADDYAERQEKFAKIRAACADLWPWIFDEKKDQA